MGVDQMSITCPYCNEPARLVGGHIIYPHRPALYAKKYWHCAPCDAYVGCHDKNERFGYTGTEPLGRLANFVLRQHKQLAHNAFDRLWRDGGNRGAAYAWLAEALGVSRTDCHIGMFDSEMCMRVVKVCNGIGRFERKIKKNVFLRLEQA